MYLWLTQIASVFCRGLGCLYGWWMSFRFILFLACFSLCLFGSEIPVVAQSCTPVPSGIVGFWPGDGYANDLAGGHNAVLGSNANVTSVGMVGSAFGFDGTNSFVQIADNPALKPPYFTVEAWVLFTNLYSFSTVAGEQYIVFKQNSLSGSFEGLALEKVVNANSQHVFHFVVIGAAGPPSAKVDSITQVTTGVWYHVAAVRDTNTLSLYINGALEAQTNVSFAQDYGSLPLYFGTTGQSYYDGRFSGILDEVSFYNRALTATEISNIYSAGASGKCRPMINDNFANRIPLSGTNILFPSSNVGSTREPGEPQHYSFPSSNSIWYSWTATAAGGLAVADNSAFIFDQIVAIYTGTNLASLTRVASNCTSQAGARAVCTTVAGQVYQLAFDDTDGQQGELPLSLTFTLAPPNDLFSNATQIVGTFYENTNGSFVGASRENGEPSHGQPAFGQTVWWVWTAPTFGGTSLPMRLMADAVSFPPAMAVYTGPSISNLLSVPLSIQTNVVSSQGTFTATPGTTYHIALAGLESDPQSSAPLVGFYRFRLNTRALGITITNLVSTTNSTPSVFGEVDFQANALITNSGTVGTGPLQISIIAINGFSSVEASNAFVTSETNLGNFSVSSAGLTPGSNANVTISGSIPGTSQPGFPFATAYGAYALLQEQTPGGNWVTVDESLVGFDAWPANGNVVGPGGGVIRLDPGYIGLSDFDPLTNVTILGPTSVVEGSSTAFTALAAYADGTTVPFSNSVWSASRFSISTNGVFTAGGVTSNTIVTITVPYSYAGLNNSTSNQVTVVNLPPPKFTNLRLLPDGRAVLSLNGVPGRNLAIETATNLTPPVVWTTLLTNAVAQNGTLTFTNPPAASANRRFYRAQELP
jgi:hypothetical protein